MISEIYSKDWFNREESDYTFNIQDKMKGIVQIPNHKYSSFLYNEDKAERICSDINMIKNEISDIIKSLGLSNILIKFSKNNPTACTNGVYIEIGVGEDYKDIDDCYEKLDYVIGLSLHEACHCLYTDFDYIKEILQKNKFSKLVFYIHNIIEDEIIEEKLSILYPGYQNFLNKLKYNIFEKKSKDINNIKTNEEVDKILEILFYLIRYPKFIAKIDDVDLNKYEQLFIDIKQIMKTNKCFSIRNKFVTKNSLNAAIEIYELLDKLFNLENVVSKNNDYKENKISKNKSEKELIDNDNDDCSRTDVHIKDKDDPIFDNNEQVEKTNNVNNKGIIGIISKIYNDISSESEQTSLKDLIVYHDEIEESEKHFKEFIWNECKQSNLNVNVYQSLTENILKYNKYKKDITPYINETKKLIIGNSKKTIIIDSKFNRNGILDPTRLANAMCNEQTVYIKKEQKHINNEPSYALIIMLDESGSMKDYSYNGENSLEILASKLSIMIYEAMSNYPKIKLFVYGHGDVVYKYIDIKNKNKYVLGARKSQWSQDELSSYKIIIDDVKSQTNLPIICFNITDSCYCAEPKKLKELLDTYKEDKKQKAFVNLICLGHNSNVDKSIKNWNDLIYGKENWVLYNYSKVNKNISKLIEQISKIIHKTIKI